MNMAFLLYNMAKCNISDKMVFEECERHFFKYKGSFKPRYAFGCLFAFYKTNAGSLDAIQFLEDEVVSNLAEISN
jgi:hypothetical protein